MNVSAVSAATLKAGWEAHEKIQYTLQALIRSPKQILRPVLCLDRILTSSWHFLSENQKLRHLSHSGHTHKKKQINVKTF